MGVAGSGKTTIGQLLGQHLGIKFFDGDDFHTSGNVQKMSSGQPLTDEDRVDWLSSLSDLIEGEGPIVLACSALKKSYRKLLADSETDLRFVFLDITPEVASARLKSRDSHFMPVSLIESQFQALERPKGAITINAENSVDRILDELKRLLN
jgi:carbohydrate kinase (thermoresistant glucokinase family)